MFALRWRNASFVSTNVKWAECLCNVYTIVKAAGVCRHFVHWRKFCAKPEYACPYDRAPTGRGEELRASNRHYRNARNTLVERQRAVRHAPLQACRTTGYSPENGKLSLPQGEVVCAPLLLVRTAYRPISRRRVKWRRGAMATLVRHGLSALSCRSPWRRNRTREWTKDSTEIMFATSVGTSRGFVTPTILVWVCY